MSALIDFRTVAGQLVEENAESNVFFLIDQGGMPGLYRQLRQTSTCWASLFSGSKEESALEVAPLLILAGANGRLVLSRAIFSWIGGRGTYTSTVMMLVSPTGLEPLQGQLSARLDVLLSEGMEAMLRFFDPRVFESLLTILTNEQAKIFLSPAISWHYVDRVGNFINVKAEYQKSQILSDFLTLSRDQETALLSASEVDQVMQLLDSNVPDLMRKIPLRERANSIFKIIKSAKFQKIESTLHLALCVMVIMIDEKENLSENDWNCISSKLGFDGVAKLKNTLEKVSVNFE